MVKISNNRLPTYLRPKMLAIMVLGFVSGLPLTLTASTLAALLQDHGIDKATIGFFAAATAPYAFKFLWAPFIDNLRLPRLTKRLGKRRSWLIVTQLLLMLAIASVSLVNYREQILILAGVMFAISIFASTQDIVIDALRIEMLKPEEQGPGAASIGFGYRIGMLFSGAGSLYLADLYSWRVAYLVMGFAIIPGMVVGLLVNEPNVVKQNERGEERLGTWLKKIVVSPFEDFIIAHKQWWLIIIFVVLYKLGDAFVGKMTNPFLLEIGFSKIEIANIVKTAGLPATLIGAFLGGYLVEKIGLKRTLFLGAILQAFSNLSFIPLVWWGPEKSILFVANSIENLCAGIGTSALVAYISLLCNIQFTATQYALLSAFAAFTRSVLVSLSGVMSTRFGWVDFFIISAIISTPTIVMVKYLFDKNGKLK